MAEAEVEDVLHLRRRIRDRLIEENVRMDGTIAMEQLISQYVLAAAILRVEFVLQGTVKHPQL